VGCKIFEVYFSKIRSENEYPATEMFRQEQNIGRKMLRRTPGKSRS
jgi:hypothetical protein